MVLLEDLQSRFDFKPLSAISPLDNFSLPSREEDPISIIKWFVDNYPLALNEKQKWHKLIIDNEGTDIHCPNHYKGLPRHYAVAFYKFLENRLCFNPEEVPTQKAFSEQLLEKHGVYPLHFGQRFIYLLCDNPKTYEFEDEWLSEGHEAREIVPVLADADSIRSAIAKSRGTTFKSNDIVEAWELHYSEDQNLLDIDPVEIAEVNPLNPNTCLLYTSPSPRDLSTSRMPSSA